MGIGNGKRQYFTGRHITDPAEAAKVTSRGGFREESCQAEIIAAGSARYFGHDSDGVGFHSIRAGCISQMGL